MNRAIERETAARDLSRLSGVDLSGDDIARAARDSGKSEEEVRDELAQVVANTQLLGGDDQREHVEEYLEKPGAETVDRAAQKALAEYYDIPLDEAREAVGEDGEPASYDDIAGIVANLVELGVDGDSEFDVSSPEFWENVKENGAGRVEKEAVAKARGLPEEAAEIDGLEASDLLDISAEMELLGGDDDPRLDPGSQEFWEQVEEEGYENVQKKAIGKRFGLPDEVVNDPDRSPEDLVKYAEESLKEERRRLEREKIVRDLEEKAPRDRDGAPKLGDLSFADLASGSFDFGFVEPGGGQGGGAGSGSKGGGVSGGRGNVPGTGAPGTGNAPRGMPETPKVAGTDTTGTPADVPQPRGSSSAGRSGGTPGGGGSSRGGSTAGGSSRGGDTGGPGTGTGSPGQGFGGSDSAGGGVGAGGPGGAVTDGSESFVVVTHNPDGSVSMSHYMVFDDGGELVVHDQAFMEETYNFVDGAWVSEQGNTFAPLGDADGPPPDGTYGTDFGDEGEYAVVGSGDDEDDDGGSGGSSGGSGGSSSDDDDDGNDDGDDGDDGDDDGDDDDGGDDGDDGGDEDESATSENESGDDEGDDSEAGKTEEGTPVPGGYATPRGTPGELHRQTGGRIGGEEVRNHERAIEAGRGGGIGAPEAPSGYVVLTPEQMQNDERQVGVKTGGAIGAPEPEKRRPLSAEDIRAVSLVLAGGGLVDPPESSPSNTPVVVPILGGPNPVVGPGGTAQTQEGGLAPALESLNALEGAISSLEGKLAQ